MWRRFGSRIRNNLENPPGQEHNFDAEEDVIAMKSTAVFLCALLLCVSSCSNKPESPAAEKAAAPAPPAPFKINLVALPEMPVPADNPMTADAVALGKQ